MVGEFDLAHAQSAATPFGAEPAEIEAAHLPQSIQTQTAGHDRIADEMATKKPQIGLDIEFGADQTLAMRAAGFGNFGNPVKHQHGRGGQLGIAGAEQFPAATGQQIIIGIA